MQEFTNKKTGSFGFIISTFISNGVEWANVVAFTAGSKRKTTMKLADLEVK
jgi:hypothetical protein